MITSTLRLATLCLLLLTTLSACATEVEPISLRDPAVSLESRKLLADLQDAVSIARLKRDGAKRDLKATLDWQEDMIEQRAWPSQASGAVSKLKSLAQGRIDLAELELELRQAELALAKSKYTLATAQAAMRHDLAVYELEPLRRDTDAARALVGRLLGQQEVKINEVDKLNQAWWSAYNDFINKGGNSRVFYQSQAKPPELKPVAKLRPKPESATPDDAKPKDAPDLPTSDKTKAKPAK